MRNSFLPSLLGSADDNDSGLEVNPTGLGSDCRKPPLCGSAQIWFFDWKTKYFPSGVHLPQHSSGGSCQPGSRRCKSVPVTDTSQASCWPMLPALSELSNRKCPLSGDHVTFLMSPFTV